MPLKLKDPRKGKSPNFSIRGTYLGVKVDKSCGTSKRSVARAQLKRLEEAIERREYPSAAEVPKAAGPTFLSAAVAYLESGKRLRYGGPLLKYFGDTPLAEIDQAAIDLAARTLRPGSVTSQNTYVYMPVSAILHFAGVDITIRRPVGAFGRKVTEFLLPEDAFALIAAAETFDRDLPLLMRFLLYTGCRVGEALAMRWDDVDLDRQLAHVRQSKNGDPRTMRLREDLTAAVAAHPRRDGEPHIFRFRRGGWMHWLLLRAKLQVCGVPPMRRPGYGRKWHVPAHRLSWVNFHTFRHTWATWMRRYGGVDVQGLVATGNWRSAKSAMRYAHVVARDEWNRVDNLPTVGKKEAS